MGTWTGILVLALCQAGEAKNETFAWRDRLHQYVGVYDAQKVSAVQLSNCRFLMDNGANMIPMPNFFAGIKEDRKRSLVWLDSVYLCQMSRYDGMAVPAIPIWTQIRNARIEECKQDYSYLRMMYLAFENPTILKTVPYRDPELDRHVAALVAGGGKLIADWKALKEVGFNSKCCKGSEGKSFLAQRNSKDSIAYAINDVLKFGWHHAINRYIPRLGKGMEPADLDAAFKNLFVKVTPNTGSP